MLARICSQRSLSFHCHSTNMHYNKPPFRSSSSCSNITSIRLYRILLRMVTNKLNDSFPLQQPLTPRQYGSASLVSQHDKENSSTQIYQFFYSLHNDEEDSFLHTWYNAVTDTPYNEERNDDDTNSLWASQSELKTAIRHAFQSSTVLTNNNNNDDDDDNRAVILSLQRLAMNAIFHISQQYHLQQTSSISMDMERGVRVVATSTCIGTTAIGGIHNNVKYRFAYRIRVENLIHSSHTVQLLGRSWKIQDVSPTTGKPVGDAQQVHAPNNGAVGHLPVLQPGQVFEYMSGCDLFTKHGTMSGSLHMAIVDSMTKSAVVGDPIDVFGAKNPVVFEMPVHEFRLEADNSHNDND